MADEYESVSDYIANILKLSIKMKKRNIALSDDDRTELLDLHDRLKDYIDMVDNAVREQSADVLVTAQSRGTEINQLIKDYRAKEMSRFGTEETDPLKNLYYSDMLNAYRRIKDHAYNIAEVVAGAK